MSGLFSPERAAELAQLKAADQKGRYTAQTEFVRPIVLEAGAGTGKTATLVGRVCAWSIGPGWDRAALSEQKLGKGPADADKIAARVMDRMVAITFTEAAAADMSEKIQEALSAIQHNKIPVGLIEEKLPDSQEERARRASALLTAADHLTVRTIHAWCKRLLTLWPLEANLHPDFEVDPDGSEVEAVVELLVAERIRTAYQEPDPDWIALAGAGVGPAEVGKAVMHLVSSGVPPTAFDDDPLPPARVRPLWRKFYQAVEAFVVADGGKLLKAKQARVAQRVSSWAADLAARLGPDGDDPALLLRRLLEGPFEDALKRLKDYAKGKFGNDELNALGDTTDIQKASLELYPQVEQLARLDVVKLQAGRRVVGGLLKKADLRLRSLGYTTFSQLLADTKNLLRSRPDVRRLIREGLDQVMVDEFQDTDQVQCDIIRMLALEGDNRPGLFLVGDPKQSIYGWRNADLAAYESFVDEVIAAKGEKHPLCVNFRSVPAILDEVERLLKPHMPAIPGIQPPFQPLVAADKHVHEKGFFHGAAAAVEHQVSWLWQDGPVLGTKGEEATALEARTLARELKFLHDKQNIPWKELVILLRVTGDADEYVGALREANIPYAVTRDRNYYQRREIIDASSLIRATLDPLDHVALVSLLRSPLCGVPDGALIPLWVEQFPKHMTALRFADPIRLAEIETAIRAAAARVSPEIPGIDRIKGWEEALLWVVHSIASLRAAFEKDPPDRFVERVRQTLLMEAGEAARYQGVWRLANLERFLRLLHHALEAGTGDEQEVLRSLRKGINEDKEAAEGRPMDASEDAVRVMTIHKAKGLDFGHVYLVQHHKKTRARSKPDLDYQELPSGPEYALFGAFTLGYPQIIARKHQIEAAERVRLLYVALTRAKVRLVTCGSWIHSLKPFTEAQTFGDLLQHRNPIPNLPDLMRIAKDTSTSFVDNVDARWRFVALEESSAGRVPPAEPLILTPPLPSPEEVAAISKTLSSKRDSATSRMKLLYGDELAVDGADLKPDQLLPKSPRTGLNSHRQEALMKAVAIACRRLLSEWDLFQAPELELARLRRRIERQVRDSVDPRDLSAVLSSGGKVLEAFGEGPLPGKLAAIPELVRGVPLSMPANPSTTVAFQQCLIDLLYEEDGELVVGFWRFDEPTDPVDAFRLAQLARLEIEEPGKMAAQALGYLGEPRLECWFVLVGEVIRI